MMRIRKNISVKNLLARINLKLLIIVSCFACHQTHDERETVSIQSTTIIESIHTRMPGEILLKDDYLVMLDPFSNNSFLRVFNILDGKEIGSAGNIGRGPDEMLSPINLQLYKDLILIFDGNSEKIGYYDINNIVDQKDPLIYIERIESFRQIFKYIKLDSIFSIGASFGNKPFKLINAINHSEESFGTYPLDEDIQNHFDVFQGAVKLHPEKDLLVYAFYSLPHLVLYKKKSDGFSIEWEKQFLKPNYSISNNSLIWDKNQLKGFTDVCFTKDYIVTTINENIKVSQGGRKMEYLPNTLYVHDYEGNFIKKCHLDIPIIRIAGNEKSNSIYSIGMNPDFCLVRYDLE